MADLFSSPEQRSLLGALEELERAAASTWAAQVDHLVRLDRLMTGQVGQAGIDGQAGSVGFLALELAGTLVLGQGGAMRRLADAQRLTDALPATLAGLAAGTVWSAQARVLLVETGQASPTVAHEVERRVLGDGRGGELCPADLRRLVKRTVLTVEAELEPAATAEREAEAFAGRRVRATPMPDGMAGLWAVLSAEQALVHQQGLDELAHRQKLIDSAAGVERSSAQRRADLLALLPALALHALDPSTRPKVTPSGPVVDDGPAAPGTAWAGAAGWTPEILVHLPAATALGLSDAPGMLVGYGPISARHARRLLPDAHLRKVLVDADTGQPLHLADRTVHAANAGSGQAIAERSDRVGEPLDGRRSGGDPAATARQLIRGWVLDEQPTPVDDSPEAGYRPSARLFRLVRTRDQRCGGPGCDQPAHRCDLDHLTAWAVGGPTSAGNLTARSRRCHNAKTHGGWTGHRHPGGGHTWTSPSGRTYWRPAPWPLPPAPRTPPPPQPGRLVPADRTGDRSSADGIPRSPAAASVPDAPGLTVPDSATPYGDEPPF